MTTFQVDSDAVLTATSAVRGSISRIQAEVGGLRANLGNLQGSWTGQAATAFQGAAEQWHSTQQRVEEVLDALNRSLGQAGTQYAETEAANARLFLG